MPLVTFDTCDLVFYACPRTGTTTIRHLLRQKDIVNIWNKRSIPNSLFKRRSFTIVRNPFDRFISSWHFALRHNLCKIRNPIRFLSWALNNDLPYSGSNWPKIRKDNHIYAKRHTAPMTSTCFMLQQADYVFRFEDFKQACQQICKLAGVQYAPLHTNATNHKEYTYYYEQYPKLKRHVLKWFAADFEKYDYPKQL